MTCLPALRNPARRSCALSLLTLDGDRWIPVSILHLTPPSLSECVEGAAADARAHGAPDDVADGFRNELAGSR